MYSSFLTVCLLLVSQECELQSEDDNIAACDLSCLSDVDYGLHMGPVFSKQEYYTNLEALKRDHLRNIAELEKVKLSQNKPGLRERQLITCWKQNEEDRSVI